MAMAVGGKKGGPLVDMNVTPLIDVLLVLLIIFMVITPLTPLGLDALVPQPNKENKPQKEEVLNQTVVVSIDAQRQVKINQDPVDIRNLEQRLTDIFKIRNQRIMFVRGDDRLEFGDVAQIIDIARGANVDKIGLITQKIEEGQ